MYKKIKDKNVKSKLHGLQKLFALKKKLGLSKDIPEIKEKMCNLVKNL